MPIVNTKEMFKKAYEGGYAIGAFNVNNMEIVQGITEAAKAVNAPVILQVSKGARAYANHTYLVKMVEAAVQETGLPIALHLDHGPDFETCKACIDGGFSSVMIDGSHLSFEENIALTKKVVDYAHDRGVTVEGELGRLAGVEDDVKVSAEDSSYTRPEEVEEFATRTGCDSLAIAIGTSHGAYKFTAAQCTRNEKGILVPPPLRFDILEEVSKRLPGFPIVLHGASSVPQEFVKIINENGGTLDTKGTMLGVLEAADSLIAEGFVPAQDLYLAFAGDEEISGDGAPCIIRWLQAHQIQPDFVLDEGGAVVENVFPGVHVPSAMVGIGEKGPMDVKFVLESAGGHASTPPPHSPVGTLAKAVARVESHPFRFQLTAPAAEMFDTLGRRSTFLYRLIFANLWCFKPVLNLICRLSGGELNALVRTTVAFTQMQGSAASNVLPPHAWVGANLRLIGDETVESAKAYLEKTIANDKIKVEVVHGMNPSAISRTDCEPWQRLSSAIRATWDGVVVSPYLMLACSDSRHYSPICPHVYRFSAMALSKAERGMIHANNERVPLDTIEKTVAFYRRLIKAC